MTMRIDLRELFHVLWDKRFYIGAITSIFSLISIIVCPHAPEYLPVTGCDDANGSQSRDERDAGTV